MNNLTFSQKVQMGLQATYRKLVLQKRQSGEMLIFSENGKVKYVDPNTVEI